MEILESIKQLRDSGIKCNIYDATDFIIKQLIKPEFRPTLNKECIYCRFDFEGIQFESTYYYSLHRHLDVSYIIHNLDNNEDIAMDYNDVKFERYLKNNFETFDRN